MNVLYYLQLEVDGDNASSHPVVEKMVILNKVSNKHNIIGTVLRVNFSRYFKGNQ